MKKRNDRGCLSSVVGVKSRLRSLTCDTCDPEKLDDLLAIDLIQPLQSSRCTHRGGTMANLDNALQQLRAERKQAQLQVEKFDQAISVIESLNGSGAVRKSTRPTRTVSAASRRRMARAQKARWAKLRKPQQSITAGSAGAPQKHLSLVARRKIAAAQRARWAKVKAQQKRAA